MIDDKFFHEFDYLGDTVYVDVCSLGLQPERTLRLCAQFQREFVRSLGRICLTEYGNVRRRAAEQFGRLIGAGADDILFETNTTRGFQMLTGSLPLREGEKVLICPGDYPSVTSHFIARGTPTALLPMREGRLDEDELIDMLDREPVRAVCVSFVQSYSGYRLDLKKLGRACRARGVYLCVDAIQGLGRNCLDVGECNIDILSCGGFKGLMGVLGAGAHYLRASLRKELPPYTYDDENCDLDFSTGAASVHVRSAAQLNIGSQNTYGIAALGESVAMLNEIGIDEIQARVRMLEDLYRQKLADLNLHWIGDNDGLHRSGNAAFLYDPARHDALAEAFRQNRIMFHLMPGRLRVGFHFYNTQRDVDRLTDVIRRVLG